MIDNTLDTVKIIPLNHCELCPFGIVKGVTTKSPMLVCRHPALSKEKQLGITSVKKTTPPEWCELMDLEDLIVRNRHEVIKIIEKTYGPLHIDPLDRLRRNDKTTIYKKPPEKDDGWNSWAKKYYGRYATKLKEDPDYLKWKSGLMSATKTKKRRR